MQEKLESLVKMLTGFGSDRMEDVGFAGLIFVLVASLISALFIAYLYRYFYASRSSGSQIHRAFPLLGISITAIFITIQFSLPLSLGLLGALSIVRFRTPIKEPEEIGFLMLVVATSLSCATFNLMLVGIILVVAVGALLLLQTSFLYQHLEDGVVLVTLPLEQQALYDRLVSLLERNTRNGKIESVSRTDTKFIVSYAFKGMNDEATPGLKPELDELIGGGSYDLFFNQQRVF